MLKPEAPKLGEKSVKLGTPIGRCRIREEGTGTEMRSAIVSGIVLGDLPVSYWPVFSPVPSNSPRSLSER